MMGDRLGLGVRGEQRLAGAAMQRLAPALQETLIGRVADQRVLETIGRIWRRAVDEEKIGFGEAFERGLKAAVVECGLQGGVADPAH